MWSSLYRGRRGSLNGKLILVTNREPYSHEKEKKGIICKKSVGGVVSALDPLMQKSKGTWIAWGSGSADFDVCDADNKVLVPEKPKYTLRRIPLSDAEITQYYQGFSNRVLWPLCHLFVEKMHNDETYWNTYYSVNQKFAQAVVEEMEPDSYIWIHDYHLALVPSFIRQQMPAAKIAYFWHIPWPPWEIFGSLPQRNDLLKGLLHSDLIGFHTVSYKKNFMHCAGRQPDASVNTKKSCITDAAHHTQVKEFPLGISYQDYAYTAQSAEIRSKAEELRAMHEKRKVILGIDRLDYTKGILNRVKAYEHFLEQYPQFQDKVVLVQIATPSRDNIEEYQTMKKELDEAVGDINSRFGTEEWTPILYFYRKIPQESLLAYYQAADVGLLTPLRDGMNLIAKEFIAAKENNGVLILSEFTGAAEELHDALMVNPYDLNQTTGAIKTAIEMPKSEQHQRFQSMKQNVKKHDAQWWLNQFLNVWDHCYD